MRAMVIKAVVAAGLLLCAMSPSQADELTKVSIALSSASLPGGAARIAKRLGFFEKHGLDPTITAMENASAATTALISGSVDFTTSGMTDVVVANARGQQMIAVVNLYGSFAPVLVLSKSVADKLGVAPDAPVLQRLKALDGLLIASTAPSDSFTLALRQAVASAGANIRLTHLGMNAMPAALESGAIQGYLASAPFYAPPVIHGLAVLWISGPKGDFPAQFTPASQNGLNTTRGFADAHPDIVRRVRAVFADFTAAARVRLRPSSHGR